MPKTPEARSPSSTWLPSGARLRAKSITVTATAVTPTTMSTAKTAIMAGSRLRAPSNGGHGPHAWPSRRAASLSRGPPNEGFQHQPAPRARRAPAALARRRGHARFAGLLPSSAHAGDGPPLPASYRNHHLGDTEMTFRGMARGGYAARIRHMKFTPEHRNEGRDCGDRRRDPDRPGGPADAGDLLPLPPWPASRGSGQPPVADRVVARRRAPPVRRDHRSRHVVARRPVRRQGRHRARQRLKARPDRRKRGADVSAARWLPWLGS